MKANGNVIKAVGLGAGVLVLIVLFCGMAAAAVIGAGTLPVSALPALSCGITCLAAAVGGAVCGVKAGTARLPLSLAVSGLYLIAAFVLRGVLFGTMGERPWILVLSAAAGALIGAVLSSKRPRRRR